MKKTNPIIKSRQYPPYAANGSTNFRYTSEKPGVYMIYRNERLVYIGYSGNNLYRTMYRHFQRWSCKKCNLKWIGISYYSQMSSHKFTVRVCLTNTATQAANLEKALILKYQPADNKDKLQNYAPTKAIDTIEQWFDEAPAKTNTEIEDEVPF